MLFKFTWVAITALALYGCPPEEKKNEPTTPSETGKLSLKSGSGRVAWHATDKVTVEAIVHEGDKPKEGVSVVFGVTCGDKKEVKFGAVKTGKDGKASAKGAVDTVTDQQSLLLCTVKAYFGEGDAATNATIQNAKEEDTMKMGMVHEGLTWAAKVGHTCANTAVYSVSGTTLTLLDVAGAQAVAINVLVLPTANNAANCTLGDHKIVADNDNAFDNETDAAGMITTPCTITTCWELGGDNSATVWSSGNDPSAAEKWIKKTGSNYVYHVVAADG